MGIRNPQGGGARHNANIPRDHWLTSREQQAILDFHERNPLEGYRRLTFMMIDEDIVAASPSSVYRVLRAHNRLDRWNRAPSKKGTGFVQPIRPHQHWHIDIAYINIVGTFYYLCSVLDGCSRAIIHWEIRESMKEAEVELIIERARERFPGFKPRMISDNGPQFIAADFKTYIRLTGMTHVRTSPYYPQSNGKIVQPGYSSRLWASATRTGGGARRWHKTLKHETIRIKSPSTLEEARTTVARFVDHYNNRRLHSALGYIAPADRLADKQEAIWASRDRKLEEARDRRAKDRQAARATRAGDAPLQMRA